MKKWIVRLEAEERERLRQLVRGVKTAAYKIRRANVLLAVDESEDGASLPDARGPLLWVCFPGHRPRSLRRGRRTH